MRLGAVVGIELRRVRLDHGRSEGAVVWWASSFGGCDWTMDAAREVDALHVKVQPYLVGAGVFASVAFGSTFCAPVGGRYLVIAYVWDARELNA